MKTFHYRWSWRLRSTPEALWPFISDTNQFNRDTGVPAIIHRPRGDRSTVRRTLSLKQFGVDVTWEEEPFEWVRPSRFGECEGSATEPRAHARDEGEQPRLRGRGFRIASSMICVSSSNVQT